MKGGKEWILWIALGAPLLALLFIGPIALISAASPQEIVSRLQDEEAKEAIRLSLVTSLSSTVLVVLFGTPLAFGLARYRFRGSSLLDSLIDLPIVLPPAVAGVALLLAFGRNGFIGRFLSEWGLQITFTPYAVVIAQVFVAAPFFLRAAIGAFRDLEPEVEHSAALDGAARATILRSVTVPAVASSIVGGTLMCWARAMGEFGATILFAGNFPGQTQTIPLAIYLGFETDFDRAVALSVLLLAVALLVLLTGRFIAYRKLR